MAPDCKDFENSVQNSGFECIDLFPYFSKLVKKLAISN